MKPLVILGSTATGKTKLALQIAQRIPQLFPQYIGVDILSADSKQVYIGQDVVPGKDLPQKFQISNFKFQGEQTKDLFFYSNKNIGIFGLDLVPPTQDWSVSQFIRLADQVKQHAETTQRFLIVVGGTGLYISSLFTPPASLFVPQNPKLRTELDRYSLDQLQQALQSEDIKRWQRMNPSDRQNPRRLVRALEVASSHLSSSEPIRVFESANWVGLTATPETLKTKIANRVLERLKNGAVEEYKKISTLGNTWSKEARATIGYSELEHFVQGGITKDELIELWTLHELQYAKRQVQWWRSHDKLIHWYDVQDTEREEHVVSDILTWYTDKK